LAPGKASGWSHSCCHPPAATSRLLSTRMAGLGSRSCGRGWSQPAAWWLPCACVCETVCKQNLLLKRNCKVAWGSKIKVATISPHETLNCGTRAPAFHHEIGMMPMLHAYLFSVMFSKRKQCTMHQVHARRGGAGGDNLGPFAVPPAPTGPNWESCRGLWCTSLVDTGRVWSLSSVRTLLANHLRCCKGVCRHPNHHSPPRGPAWRHPVGTAALTPPELIPRASRLALLVSH
jgi:hypothetical protein